MTRIALATHPHLLGFDQLERMAERAAQGAEGYPPYNIEQRGADGLRITIAVAGFAPDDLSVTVEDRQMFIRGSKADSGDNRVFLHRGIAARAFQRSFVLAIAIEAERAWIENGLLHIDLRRIAPQAVVKTIPIGRR